MKTIQSCLKLDNQFVSNETKYIITIFKLVLPDVPGKPGLPEIIDWAENMVKLKWEPPIRDGGAPITGYIIEMKDKFGTTYVKAAEVDKVCTGTVTRLEEGNQYQFRVRAVNKAGAGEPSEATNPHTAKARWRKCYLNFK